MEGSIKHSYNIIQNIIKFTQKSQKILQLYDNYIILVHNLHMLDNESFSMNIKYKKDYL